MTSSKYSENLTLTIYFDGSYKMKHKTWFSKLFSLENAGFCCIVDCSNRYKECKNESFY